MEPRTDAHTEEEVRLAREIAGALADGHRTGQFGKLVIIAAPRLLGYLRDSLAAPVRQSVTNEIDKDLTAYDAAALTDWLRKELWEK